MAIKFNNTNVTVVKFNGADVKYVKENGAYKWAKPFTLTLNRGTGTTIAVSRISSYEPSAQPRPGAEEVLQDGDTVYYGDVIRITTSLQSGYKNLHTSISGAMYIDTHICTVVDNVTVNTSATRIIWGVTVIWPSRAEMYRMGYENLDNWNAGYGYNERRETHHSADFDNDIIIDLTSYNLKPNITTTRPGQSQSELLAFANPSAFTIRINRVSYAEKTVIICQKTASDSSTSAWNSQRCIIQNFAYNQSATQAYFYSRQGLRFASMTDTTYIRYTLVSGGGTITTTQITGDTYSDSSIYNVNVKFTVSGTCTFKVKTLVKQYLSVKEYTE